MSTLKSTLMHVLLLVCCLALWGLAGHLQYEDEMNEDEMTQGGEAQASVPDYPLGRNLRLACRPDGQPDPRQATAWVRPTRVVTRVDDAAPLQELRCVVLEFDEED